VIRSDGGTIIIADTYPNEKLMRARVPNAMEINNKLTTRRAAAAFNDILKHTDLFIKPSFKLA